MLLACLGRLAGWLVGWLAARVLPWGSGVAAAWAAHKAGTGEMCLYLLPAAAAGHAAAAGASSLAGWCVAGWLCRQCPA